MEQTIHPAKIILQFLLENENLLKGISYINDIAKYLRGLPTTIKFEPTYERYLEEFSEKQIMNVIFQLIRYKYINYSENYDQNKVLKNITISERGRIAINEDYTFKDIIIPTIYSLNDTENIDNPKISASLISDFYMKKIQYDVLAKELENIRDEIKEFMLSNKIDKIFSDYITFTNTQDTAKRYVKDIVEKYVPKETREKILNEYLISREGQYILRSAILDKDIIEAKDYFKHISMSEDKEAEERENNEEERIDAEKEIEFMIKQFNENIDAEEELDYGPTIRNE